MRRRVCRGTDDLLRTAGTVFGTRECSVLRSVILHPVAAGLLAARADLLGSRLLGLCRLDIAGFCSDRLRPACLDADGL